jgi:predicted phosphodiesterase
MKDADADIMCFGHTHKHYHRILNLDDAKERFRHAINIGSVGKPKDGDNRACYVLLRINEQSSIQIKDSVSAEFIHVEYDVEKAARAVEESKLPDEYAEMLRKAY